MKIASSPVYLDTSALAKLYLPETLSDELEDALKGRHDIIVSDLAITELTSAIARRRRDGDISARHADQLHRRILDDVERGEFLHSELTAEVHRAAEQLLLRSDTGGVLRAADALHVAMATLRTARAILTFDARLAAAARAAGVFEVVGA